MLTVKNILMASAVLILFAVGRYCIQWINRQRGKRQDVCWAECNEKIRQLEIYVKDQQQVIETFRIQSERFFEQHSKSAADCEAAVSGIRFYIDALHNCNLSQLSSDELHSFVCCYSQIDKHFFYYLQKEKIQLSPRELFICILIRMGKEKTDIFEILRCSDGAYRTLKNRIKGKLRIPSDESCIEAWIKGIRCYNIP